jgi:hypothetical protein
MAQVLDIISIEIGDPPRLFVEVASILALHTIQSNVSQIFEYLDSLTETLIRSIALISQDTFQLFPQLLALVKSRSFFVVLA